MISFKIYRECGDPCPRSCADLTKNNAACPIEFSQPGCFCPDGYVTQGDKCIREEECMCVCRGWGDPHYQESSQQVIFINNNQ